MDKKSSNMEIFIFKSDPKGVSEITQHEVIKTSAAGKRSYPKPESEIIRYHIQGSPYQVDIYADREYGVDQRLRSTYGNIDPWTGSTWCSLNREVLEELRSKESLRLKDYGKTL